MPCFHGISISASSASSFGAAAILTAAAPDAASGRATWADRHKCLIFIAEIRQAGSRRGGDEGAGGAGGVVQYRIDGAAGDGGAHIRVEIAHGDRPIGDDGLDRLSGTAQGAGEVAGTVACGEIDERPAGIFRPRRDQPGEGVDIAFRGRRFREPGGYRRLPGAPPTA